jgi:hypothetical protein
MIPFIIGGGAIVAAIAIVSAITIAALERSERRGR